MKRLFKKHFLLAALVLMFSFFVFSPAQAQIDLGLEYAQSIGLGSADIRIIIARVINAAFGLLSTIAVSIVLYGGFIYMTAAGDESKVQKGKDILRNGAIGLAIIFSAAAIANLIFNVLGIGGRGAYSFKATGVDEYEGGSGALGNGIIQTHFPPRNAVDVPRNTSIVITFKEKVASDMIINLPAADCAISCSGKIKPVAIGGTFSIFSQQIDNGNPNTNITVSTPDGGKTFIFKPDQFLGSADNVSTYAVTIERGLKKFNNDPAFAPSATNPLGYDWQFEVSTKLDTTPPTVVNVLPPSTNNSAEKVDRNYLVQINFSEPMNPATISGDTKAFNNIVTSLIDSDTAIAGHYEYSNNYQTVEFFTNDICGKNSCGNDVFCLPPAAEVKVLAKSATVYLSSEIDYRVDLPFAASLASGNYTGVVDLAGNAMDGNKNGVADNSLASYKLPAVSYYENYPTYGSDFNLRFDPDIFVVGEAKTHILTDDYQWSFFTNNNVDLNPPLVNNYTPLAGQQYVDPRGQPLASFDKYLSSSSIKPGTNYGDGYCICASTNDCNKDLGERCSAYKGYCVKDTTTEVGQRVSCVTYLPSSCKTERAGGTVALKDVCIQKEFVVLDQDKAAADPNNQTWYVANKKDNNTNPDPNLRQTDVGIDHGLLLNDKTYGVRYGSGVMDIKQNCYTPNAAPGCVRVPLAGAGEFTQDDTQWSGLYPTCDLTTSTFGSEGNFNLSYVDPSGTNKLLSISAFSWDQPAVDIYDKGLGAIGQKFEFFAPLLTPQNITYALYFEQTDGDDPSKGDYYLIVVGASEIPTTTLAEAVKTDDTQIKLTSAQGLPQDGTIIISGNIITYSGIVDRNTLANVSGLSNDFPVGQEVIIEVPRAYKFEYGPIDSSVITNPVIESFSFSEGASPSAELSWSGAPGETSDALVHKIGNSSQKVTLVFTPQEDSTAPLKVRFLYPGGITEFDGTKQFTLELQ